MNDQNTGFSRVHHKTIACLCDDWEAREIANASSRTQSLDVSEPSGAVGGLLRQANKAGYASQYPHTEEIEKFI